MTPQTINEMITARNTIIDELSSTPDNEKPSMYTRINNLETLISQRKNSYRITR
jgi:hypothetical protein